MEPFDEELAARADGILGLDPFAAIESRD